MSHGRFQIWGDFTQVQTTIKHCPVWVAKLEDQAFVQLRGAIGQGSQGTPSLWQIGRRYVVASAASDKINLKLWDHAQVESTDAFQWGAENETASKLELELGDLVYVVVLPEYDSLRKMQEYRARESSSVPQT